MALSSDGYCLVSLYCAVDTATSYGRDGRGLIPSTGKIFLFSTATTLVASYPMGTWGSFPGGKAAGP
jgi:hypothetical protein